MAKEMVILDVEKLRRRMSLTQEELWKKHCIYRVPAYLKEHSPRSYSPQLVSVGPYHHGEFHLRAMEEHKHRAVQHLLQRSAKPIEDFRRAIEGDLQRLMDSYEQLEAPWDDRETFLQLMMLDGCFLYEVLRGYSTARDYEDMDPVFSFHGFLNICPYMVPDLLMIENQLPLRVIERIYAVEHGRMNDENGHPTNELVHKFLSNTNTMLEMPLGLHVLDVARKGITRGPFRRLPEQRLPAIAVRSSSELQDAGIIFRKSPKTGIKEINFSNGTLTLPPFSVDNSTESVFLNFIAFERLHPGAGRDVSSYMAFMSGLMNSVKDVTFLMSTGLIEGTLGSDEAIAKLINDIAKNVFFDPSSSLCEVRDALNRHYAEEMKNWSRRVREWRRNLRDTYFKNPWTLISLIAAAFLLGFTLTQTVYSALSFYKTK
ncbi:UPF0481 protein At3g47200-like [Aristolochia californica]|uniref:UPF0481 protein At3g47200-like n=1 Tax=Aristolochia californica TaxID=171875 RepID=UPI0035D7E61C